MHFIQDPDLDLVRGTSLQAQVQFLDGGIEIGDQDRASAVLRVFARENGNLLFGRDRCAGDRTRPCAPETQPRSARSPAPALHEPDASSLNALPVLNCIFVAGLVYDWCYPLMTAEERERVIARAEELCASMEVGFPRSGRASAPAEKAAQISRFSTVPIFPLPDFSYSANVQFSWTCTASFSGRSKTLPLMTRPSVFATSTVPMMRLFSMRMFR